MASKSNCNCCSENNQEVVIGEYVCYCNNVKEEDIVKAMQLGADTVEKVIKTTGAMKNSNCAVNNPKGTCCYSDIVYVLINIRIIKIFNFSNLKIRLSTTYFVGSFFVHKTKFSKLGFSGGKCNDYKR